MKARQFKLFGISLIVSVLLTVTACQKTPVLVGPYHPFTPYQMSLVKQLRKAGVPVIKQAEVLQIVLPTDKFFRFQTTRIRQSQVYYVGLVRSLVTSYISYYKRPHIRVSGYTDTVFSKMTRKGLSYQYAKVIAVDLWHGSIPQRWIVIKGYGARYPIGDNKTVVGAAYNRRVVVRVN